MLHQIIDGRSGKWLKWTAGVSLFSLIACFVLDKLVQHRKSDKALRRLFRKKHIQATIHYTNAGGRQLRYLAVGDDNLPTLFFLHGSPGSLSFYQRLLTDPVLLQTFKMISIDRPGYGYSGFGVAEPSIEQQTNMIQSVIEELNTIRRPLIIIGYSYGAAIACRLLMNHPGIADGLLLLAPPIMPGKEKYFWFTPVVERSFIRRIIPRLFKSINTEKFYHAGELTKMLPYWNRIRVPVLYVQGEKDSWAYIANAGFAQVQLTNVPWLRIELLKDRGHFFTYTNQEIIRQRIFELYSSLTNASVTAIHPGSA
ncbi:alpha/beta fold hydrolase [Longitalea luteola]|uniref:alpha/beta fold hydrolase n=1 Tax=Longitalea luteola TaxID=2812563 RepID=UPI001A95CC9B|nr:alpha/beta hydrolase [Longitalea luteola]